jgi:hypothetical protein
MRSIRKRGGWILLALMMACNPEGERPDAEDTPDAGQSISSPGDIDAGATLICEGYLGDDHLNDDIPCCEGSIYLHACKNDLGGFCRTYNDCNHDHLSQTDLTCGAQQICCRPSGTSCNADADCCAGHCSFGVGTAAFPNVCD